jgi:hypothetical protein
VALHDHPKGIADEEDLDPSAARQFRERCVIGGDAGEALTPMLEGFQGLQGDSCTDGGHEPIPREWKRRQHTSQDGGQRRRLEFT